MAMNLDQAAEVFRDAMHPWQDASHHEGDKAAPCPLDRVSRQLQAPRPNALWVSDFTYVATWIGFATDLLPGAYSAGGVSATAASPSIAKEAPASGEPSGRRSRT